MLLPVVVMLWTARLWTQLRWQKRIGILEVCQLGRKFLVRHGDVDRHFTFQTFSTFFEILKETDGSWS